MPHDEKTNRYLKTMQNGLIIQTMILIGIKYSMEAT